MSRDRNQPEMHRDLIAVRPKARRRVKNQAGMTTLGFLILGTFMGIFAYATLRLTPVYLNYLKVVSVIEGVRKEFDGQAPSRTLIRRSIGRRFDIEAISTITARDIKVTSDSGGFLVQAVYNHEVPFLANVSFSVHFDKRALIRR